MHSLKRRSLSLLTSFMLTFPLLPACPQSTLGAAADSSSVRIDEEHFPDPIFRELISGPEYDRDQNGYIDPEDVTYGRNIYCEGMGITSVKGVEYFTELRGLWCKDNNIKSLDISSLGELTGLWCSGNPLTELDLTHNPELLWVYCFDCELTKVDFSQNPKMAFIEINTNNLTELDVTANPELEHLTCGTCGLKELDLRNNKKLAHLDAFMNNLTELDLSNNTKLKRLDIWGNGGLGSVDISSCTGLQYYSCAFNGVTELDLKNHHELYKLICSYNAIKELDLSGNPKLICLNCELNQLKKLDLSHNPKLRYLQAALNPFTELDIRNCPKLVKTYEQGEQKTEYYEDEDPLHENPVGQSWTLDLGSDDSTGGDSIYYLWLDDKVNITAEPAGEAPDEEYYSEPDPGVTERDMIKRERIAQILYEMAGSPDVTGLTSRFTDADPDSYYYSALLWGEENKICMGFPEFSDDIFGVGKYITRQDLLFMLMRFSAYMGYERKIDFGRADDFLDYYEVDYDHWEAVTWAATWHILEGKGKPGAPKEERRIDPFGRATVTELEAFINRMYEINNIDDEFTYVPEVSGKGDVNGDGNINMQDYALLQRWLADWDVEIVFDEADMDGDGKVNMVDYALLQRKLAGWDID